MKLQNDYNSSDFVFTGRAIARRLPVPALDQMVKDKHLLVSGKFLVIGSAYRGPLNMEMVIKNKVAGWQILCQFESIHRRFGMGDL